MATIVIHQSRFSLHNEINVREIIKRNRRRGSPCNLRYFLYYLTHDSNIANVAEYEILYNLNVFLSKSFSFSKSRIFQNFIMQGTKP